MACLEKGKGGEQFEGPVNGQSVPTIDYQLDWFRDSITYMQKGANVDSVQMTSEKKMQIAYIESTYNCSGFCTPGLFYITQSIEKGTPARSCFQPVMKDIDYYLDAMRIQVKVGLIMILLMMFSTFVIMR